TSGKTRVAALPELPTVAEAGLAGYEAALWVSLVMPAATPPTMIARLNREVNDILKSTEGTEALVAQGMAAEPGPPGALTERIRGDIEKWRGVAVKAGIRLQEQRSLSEASAMDASLTLGSTAIVRSKFSRLSMPALLPKSRGPLNALEPRAQSGKMPDQQTRSAAAGL